MLCDCIQLAHRFSEARAEARAAALEEAARVAETFFTNPHATDLSARALTAVTARIRALVEESP
ncbi:hypothetical protein ACN6KF_003002 [Labrys sp. La1]|uniref:hypothetical protein n=1 Tax=Labrys sp. La1 TaxID=3404917 RepID=UPI003EBDEBF4